VQPRSRRCRPRRPESGSVRSRSASCRCAPAVFHNT
jgi:hypothetical protein